MAFAEKLSNPAEHADLIASAKKAGLVFKGITPFGVVVADPSATSAQTAAAETFVDAWPLRQARSLAVGRIESAFVTALATDNPSGYSFTRSGQSYIMPVTLDHQALATLALLQAQASGGTVNIPHTTGILDVTDNAAGVAILAGYAVRFVAHTRTRYLRNLSIEAATTKTAVDAIVW